MLKRYRGCEADAFGRVPPSRNLDAMRRGNLQKGVVFDNRLSTPALTYQEPEKMLRVLNVAGWIVTTE